MITLGKEDIKQALREVIQEDRVFVKTILKELPEEAVAIEPDRQAKVDAIIRRDFERYKKVFKALA